MQSLVKLDHHDGWITWLRYGSTGVKRFSRGHNDTLPTLETEPGDDNLAIANFFSYTLNCTVASWNESVEVPFPRTQQRIISSVGIELATLPLLFGAPD